MIFDKLKQYISITLSLATIDTTISVKYINDYYVNMRIITCGACLNGCSFSETF